MSESNSSYNGEPCWTDPSLLDNGNNPPVYFYTTYEPHEFSGGPHIFTRDPATGYDMIASLDRAEELARLNWVNKFGQEGHVRTTYGLMFTPEGLK